MSGSFTPIPRPPTQRGGQVDTFELAKWFDRVWMALSNTAAIAWKSINFKGSSLSDIESRSHSQLKEILGEGDRHVSIDQAASVAAIGNAGVGMIAKTSGATFVARTITGTTGEIDVTNGDGASGDPVIGLPDLITTPRSFGAEVDNTTFEEDGTVKFNGAATVWKDVMFPMAPPKTSGAGNPSLVTYNGNLRGYSFAVNDVHDFDPQEMEHDSKVGSTATFHIHWLSRSNDGTDRAVKWELEYDEEPGSGPLPVTTTASVEVVIPAGSAVNTVQRTDITTFTITAIARLVGARVKRVVSTGAAPSVDPVLRALHFHYEIDTVGSRQILTK